MRIQFRGGVWKNSEDEILKAAVMKYGMNQWARIASLLGRKSATQCKARWYEWLDPAIKKTAWTREEEEKLLHLVKVMPTSWRTIAPMIGRTAAQCIEHYEELIDQAQQGDGANGTTSGSAALVSSSVTGGRGRPGDADAAPETKPARPDPVDMDEDELEMLSEARARLANTKGKKAKRKAREKQLEVAKRLALLQKRRELKAAGIDVKLFRKKKNVTDYGTEIPFERRPAAGFFDTTAEDSILEKKAGQKDQIGKLLQKYKGKTAAEKEDEAQKRDKAKRKELEKTNLPAALGIDRVQAPRSPPLKKARLSLPPPQLSDLQLAKLSKAKNGLLSKPNSTNTMKSTEPPLANGTRPTTRTRSGVESQSNSGRFTPEPWAVARQRQVQTLVELKSAGTPLRGGPNPDVKQLGLAGRVTPAPSDWRTPNPLATPLMTPGSVHGSNTGSDGRTDRISILAEIVKRGFRNLPEPENEYEIDVTNDANQSDDSTDISSEFESVELDAEDEARRRREGKGSLLESERARLLSSSAKRGLPIPRAVAQEDILSEELNFLIHRDTEYHRLLQEEKENRGIVTVSMLDRLQEVTDQDHLSQKDTSKGMELVNEEIAKDGSLAFDFQDQVMDILKSKVDSSGDEGPHSREDILMDVTKEKQVEHERNERYQILQGLYERALEYESKMNEMNDLHAVEQLRERFVGEKNIIPEAATATDEKTILNLIEELKKNSDRDHKFRSHVLSLSPN